MDPDVKKMIVDALFQDPGFEDTWVELKNEYEMLGFKDEISDVTMISEFKYIAQQLRKYKFSKQDQILKHDSFADMVKEVESLIAKADEYADDRKGIVYNFMRDHWLLEVYNTLARAVMFQEDEEEEDA